MSTRAKKAHLSRKARITGEELVNICTTVAQTVDADNLLGDQLAIGGENVFCDKTTQRSLDGWIYKIAFDHINVRGQKGFSRAYSIGEIINFKINDFVSSPEGTRIIDKLLQRKLTPIESSEVRLLWIGDQGWKFASLFMYELAVYIQATGNTILFVPKDDEEDEE